MDKSGWTYKRLDEVCDKGSSNIVINKLESNEGDYPLFGASGIVKSVDFYHQDKPYIGIVKDGSGVGRVNTYPAYSSLVGTMQYILPKNAEQLDYIKYFLEKLDLSHLVTGAAIPHIYFKDYGKKIIPIPSKETQSQIVEELDAINESITMLQQQVKDLDDLAQSIFYDMFGDPVENGKRWKVKKLGDLAQIKTGPFGSMLHKEDYVQNGIPLVNPVHMKDYHVIVDMNFTITAEKAEELNNYILKTNDIIFARRGDIGRCAVITADENGYLCGTGSLFVRFEEDLSPVYTMYIVRSTSFTELLNSVAKGATMLNLNSSAIAGLQIPIPSYTLQQAFASKIHAIEGIKSSLNTQIKEMQTLLASRMQYWFD